MITIGFIYLDNLVRAAVLGHAIGSGLERKLVLLTIKLLASVDLVRYFDQLIRVTRIIKSIFW